MTFMYHGIMAVVTLGAVASAAPAPIEWGELSAYAAVVIAFGLMLRWLLTTLQTRMEKQDATLIKISGDMVRSLDVNTAALMALMQQNLVHDLTVSGVNPSMGDTEDERIKGIQAKQRELHQICEDVRRAMLRSGKRTPDQV